MSNRCDEVTHCDDISDEMDCTMLHLDKDQASTFVKLAGL
jgi:hypothetical protein